MLDSVRPSKDGGTATFGALRVYGDALSCLSASSGNALGLPRTRAAPIPVRASRSSSVSRTSRSSGPPTSDTPRCRCESTSAGRIQPPETMVRASGAGDRVIAPSTIHRSTSRASGRSRPRRCTLCPSPRARALSGRWNVPDPTTQTPSFGVNNADGSSSSPSRRLLPVPSHAIWKEWHKVGPMAEFVGLQRAPRYGLRGCRLASLRGSCCVLAMSSRTRPASDNVRIHARAERCAGGGGA